jgi:hypothetical protein
LWVDNFCNNSLIINSHSTMLGRKNKKATITLTAKPGGWQLLQESHALSPFLLSISIYLFLYYHVSLLSSIAILMTILDGQFVLLNRSECLSQVSISIVRSIRPFFKQNFFQIFEQIGFFHLSTFLHLVLISVLNIFSWLHTFKVHRNEQRIIGTVIA